MLKTRAIPAYSPPSSARQRAFQTCSDRNRLTPCFISQVIFHTRTGWQHFSHQPVLKLKLCPPSLHPWDGDSSMHINLQLQMAFILAKTRKLITSGLLVTLLKSRSPNQNNEDASQTIMCYCLRSAVEKASIMFSGPRTENIKLLPQKNLLTLH